MPKRVFVVVLDSFGIGEEPDAAVYGDEGRWSDAHDQDREAVAEYARLPRRPSLPYCRCIE